MRITRRLIATLSLATMAVTTAALLPSSPASAAPPAVTHSRVVSEDPVDNTPHVIGDNVRTEAVLDLGTRVIVGGTFTQVKRFNQPATFDRSYLFAYDKATGTIDTRFVPQPNGRVSSLLLAPDGNILVAGQFKSIAGRPIPHLAKLNPTTGEAITAFAPSPDGMVYDMHLANGQLYVGGTFTRVGGTTRTNFAVVDPGSGALRGTNVGFADAPRGTTRLMRLDVTPDGRKLVAIGTFARVGGQNRSNIAVLDLASNGGATVNGWNTDRYRDMVCGPSWDTVIYDADISPDGRYFVAVTTGGPRGTTTLCDTATRWELNQTGTATPTWSNYTGGDSLTSVAVTGAAVYIAGHHRWIDNPQGHDSKGPGALDRPGISALDPTTGRGLAWNPGRERGLVAPRLVPTPEGLYVLSDSSRIGGEWHPRLAFLPLPGVTPPTPQPEPPAPAPVSAPGAPGAPKVLSATGTSVRLSWTAPNSSGTSPIQDYRVTIRSGSTGTVVGTVSRTGLSGSPGGLQPGTLYRFSVAARNASGYGPESGLSAPALPPFPSLDAFTDRQHRDITNRAATAAQLASWRTSLAEGRRTPAELISSLLDGQSTVDSVTRLYSAYFLRLPDTSGLNYWIDQARRGRSLGSISQYFSASPEFNKRYGRLSNRDFVALIYRNVLSRKPDATGLNFWTRKLDQGSSRGWVMVGFSDSPEYARTMRGTTQTVATYQALLRRAPSTSERATWEPQLRGSTSRSVLVATILALPAYSARF